MSTIVKRKGHSEEYDSRKIYGGVYAACLSVRVPQGEAELVADKVSSEISAWVKERDQVNSQEISEKVTESLGRYNPDAAFMYKTHKDLS